MWPTPTRCLHAAVKTTPLRTMHTHALIQNETLSFELLAAKLAEDQACLAAGRRVGDSGMLAPRLGGAEDKRTGLAHQLARHLFPCEDKDRTLAYIQYGRLLAKLRQAWLEQREIEEPTHVEDNPYRIARLPGHRAQFEALLQVPFSDGILHPTPMPVDVAPLEDLKPVFQHLESGTGAPESLPRMEFTRGALDCEGRMDMCKQVVADRHIGALVDSVQHNANVQHFLLGNNIVGDAGAAHIARLVSNPQTGESIQTLYLAGNCIGTSGSASLADALRDNHTVKSLWLKRNPLHLEGVQHLASMLETNASLETLDLANTGLFDEGIAVLFASLRKNTTLRTLYIDANGITPAGARHIAAYFEFLKSEGRVGLTGLFASINRLGDEGAKLIAEGVKGYEHLVRLELSSNRIQQRGLEAILEVASGLPSLRYLGVGFYKSTTDLGELPNYFDGNGADLIADFLRHNQTLQVLDLRDTNLRPGGLELIVEALESNHSLLHLYADQYGASLDPAYRQRLDALLACNVEATLGLSLRKFRKNPLRFIKHTENIRHIDSIYRNRM